MVKKVLLVLAAAILSSTLTSAAVAAEAEFVLKVAHSLSMESQYQVGFNKMDELLNEYTNGAVRLEFYPGGQLGGERDFFEGCQMGTIDIGLGGNENLVDFYPEFYLYDLPFLFNGPEEVDAVLHSDVMQEMYDGLESVGLVGLTAFDNGFFYVINSQKKVAVPEDIKGLTLRVMENDIYQMLFTTLGANPVPMAFTEVFTSLQNGTIDGLNNPVATIYDAKFNTVCDNFLDVPLTYVYLQMIMSKQTYDKLPPEYQEAVHRAAKEAREYEAEYVRSSSAKKLQEMVDAGMVVSGTGNTQLWKDAVYDKVYSYFIERGDVSQETLDRVQKVIASAPK